MEAKTSKKVREEKREFLCGAKGYIFGSPSRLHAVAGGAITTLSPTSQSCLEVVSDKPGGSREHDEGKSYHTL
jgi:hypothetical protein